MSDRVFIEISFYIVSSRISYKYNIKRYYFFRNDKYTYACVYGTLHFVSEPPPLMIETMFPAGEEGRRISGFRGEWRTVSVSPSMVIVRADLPTTLNNALRNRTHDFPSVLPYTMTVGCAVRSPFSCLIARATGTVFGVTCDGQPGVGNRSLDGRRSRQTSSCFIQFFLSIPYSRNWFVSPPPTVSEYLSRAQYD